MSGQDVNANIRTSRGGARASYAPVLDSGGEEKSMMVYLQAERRKEDQALAATLDKSEMLIQALKDIKAELGMVSPSTTYTNVGLYVLRIARAVGATGVLVLREDYTVTLLGRREESGQDVEAVQASTKLAAMVLNHCFEKKAAEQYRQHFDSTLVSLTLRTLLTKLSGDAQGTCPYTAAYVWELVMAKSVPFTDEASFMLLIKEADERGITLGRKLKGLFVQHAEKAIEEWEALRADQGQALGTFRNPFSPGKGAQLGEKRSLREKTAAVLVRAKAAHSDVLAKRETLLGLWNNVAGSDSKLKADVIQLRLEKEEMEERLAREVTRAEAIAVEVGAVVVAVAGGAQGRDQEVLDLKSQADQARVDCEQLQAQLDTNLAALELCDKEAEAVGQQSAKVQQDLMQVLAEQHRGEAEVAKLQGKLTDLDADLRGDGHVQFCLPTEEEMELMRVCGSQPGMVFGGSGGGFGMHQKDVGEGMGRLGGLVLLQHDNGRVLPVLSPPAKLLFFQKLVGKGWTSFCKDMLPPTLRLTLNWMKGCIFSSLRFLRTSDEGYKPIRSALKARVSDNQAEHSASNSNKKLDLLLKKHDALQKAHDALLRRVSELEKKKKGNSSSGAGAPGGSSPAAGGGKDGKTNNFRIPSQWAAEIKTVLVEGNNPARLSLWTVGPSKNPEDDTATIIVGGSADRQAWMKQLRESADESARRTLISNRQTLSNRVLTAVHGLSGGALKSQYFSSLRVAQWPDENKIPDVAWAKQNRPGPSRRATTGAAQLRRPCSEEEAEKMEMEAARKRWGKTLDKCGDKTVVRKTQAAVRRVFPSDKKGKNEEDTNDVESLVSLP